MRKENIMDKKEFKEKQTEYNRQLKELQEKVNTITTKKDLDEYNKKVDFILAEKLKLEKQQLEDLQKVEKARLQKKTNTLNAKLRKERTHRLCVLGGLVEQQLGDTADPELYEQIQEFLSIGYLKKYFNKWIEVKAAATSAQPVDNPPQ